MKSSKTKTKPKTKVKALPAPKPPRLSYLETMPESALKGLVKDHGNPTRFARRVGVSRQALYTWMARGFVPPIRAVQLEAIFGVPRLRLMDPLLISGSIEELTGLTREQLQIPEKVKSPD